MDGLKLNNGDIEVLTSIADYRLLSARQIAVLHRRNLEVVRRRLRAFENHGLVRIASRGAGETRGRPEGLASLTSDTVSVLIEEGILNAAVDADSVLADGVRCLDHHLLANEFRIQAARIPAICPSLQLRFAAPASPLLDRVLPGPFTIEERFMAAGRQGHDIRFRPDGVFAMTHADAGRTVLCYLEVDMGTETLASPNGRKQDIQEKILNYQECFRGRHYRRYEQAWSCRLQGFRLLVLACSAARMGALCQLVRAMPPSDFVWLTDRSSLLEYGAWAPIWTAGGDAGAPRRSILGSLLPSPCPRPGE